MFVPSPSTEPGYRQPSLQEAATLMGEDPGDLCGYILIGVNAVRFAPPVLVTDTSDPAEVVQVLGHILVAIGDSMTGLKRIAPDEPS